MLEGGGMGYWWTKVVQQNGNGDDACQNWGFV